MNKTRKHKAPGMVIFALWILNRHIRAEINPHETAAGIAAASTVEKMMALSGTVKEAEQICKERRIRKEGRRYV